MYQATIPQPQDEYFLKLKDKIVEEAIKIYEWDLKHGTFNEAIISKEFYKVLNPLIEAISNLITR